MFWLIDGQVLAHLRRCIDLLMESGDSLEEMCWLIGEDVLAHRKKYGG